MKNKLYLKATLLLNYFKNAIIFKFILFLDTVNRLIKLKKINKLNKISAHSIKLRP